MRNKTGSDRGHLIFAFHRYFEAIAGCLAGVTSSVFGNCFFIIGIIFSEVLHSCIAVVLSRENRWSSERPRLLPLASHLNCGARTRIRTETGCGTRSRASGTSGPPAKRTEELFSNF